ncbi:MAG TPA: hypothetical protein VJP85_06060 [Candidatus Baltobacteraceae bacterium]|nr:hypothetical protein [Candidatus Baltobacteraceae bacterium]
MTTTGSTGSSTRQKIVPLVSSDTAGPLGAIHLPRLWAKLSLAASGLLPEGYDECGPGFDQMTLSALGLDRQKTIDYVRNNRPTYLQFEKYVRDQNGGSIDAERIRKHNEAVRGYHHNDQLAAEMRKSCGLIDEMISDAVTLNKLEDLDELHHQLTRS